MPKTWSYREYDQIELSINRKKGLPLAGWLIFGVTGAILCVIFVVCIGAMNPPRDNESHGKQVYMPTNSYNNYGR
jgi:hypothetical protein